MLSIRMERGFFLPKLTGGGVDHLGDGVEENESGVPRRDRFIGAKEINDPDADEECHEVGPRVTHEELAPGVVHH